MLNVLLPLYLYIEFFESNRYKRKEYFPLGFLCVANFILYKVHYRLSKSVLKHCFFLPKSNKNRQKTLFFCENIWSFEKKAVILRLL